MPDADVIAEHAFFGAVTVKQWSLVFHPPSGGPGLEYTARFTRRPTRKDYDALAARLPAFQAFCERVGANDALVRDHFRTWPRSAGTFDLLGVMTSGEDYSLPWPLEPGQNMFDPPDNRRFALQYRALDEDAWGFAGITWYPPEFVALFDAAGAFSGIDHHVERGMRTLPEAIPVSRWTDGYDHPYFGRCELSEYAQIGSATVSGQTVPINLFMTTRRMASFEPEQLDSFVPLIERFEDLDTRLRATFPDKVREDWLEDCFKYGYPALADALKTIFPQASAAREIAPEDFAAALTLDRACFSLSPESSSGAALTLDYRIVPSDIDAELFAVKYAESGDLLSIVAES